MAVLLTQLHETRNEHLFLGILREGEGVAVDILLNNGVDLLMLKGSIEKSIKADRPVAMADNDILPLLKSTERVLRLVHIEAKAMKTRIIDTEHLLMAILRDESNLVTRFLTELDIDYSLVKKAVEASNPAAQADYPRDEDDEGIFSSPGSGKQQQGGQQAQQRSSSETPVLDNFGIDLTKAAEEGRLDPVVGREREIERLAQILSRRKKNNPVLIGEPGVGKSAIAEGLALRITKRNVSRVLFNKRVVALDLASIVAGTKYRGQFEERMKAILNELAKNDNIILFIDEIHTIVGAGGASGSLDAANMLKPALARGEIQCIGATTLDEYRQHIEKDGALERRFQKVLVDPTTIEETIEILNNIKERYEEHHNVTYTPEAIQACVRLTNRYISDRNLPDKAIDALDESGSRVHISNIVVPEKILALEKQLEETKKEKSNAVKNQNYERAASFRDKERDILDLIEAEKKRWEKELALNREVVDEEKVAEVVAMMTGVPVQRIAQTEGTRLLQMAEELKTSVVGQDEAIGRIVKSIQRNRAGLKDPNKPIGTFIFLGPTGVGKTQLAKVLAKFLFDTTDNLIRVDMSEYMEKFSVSRLVGAPPGYVGYEEGGQLTEKVRRKPYSVVLLDEIEKAHPDVFHILLQVLDEGQLTDSLGRRVDFRNTIVIMTSNIGTRQLTEFGAGVGFDTSAKRTTGLFDRISALGYRIKLSPQARDFMADRGFDVQYGARPLKRAIQKYLEDPLAEVIIKTAVAEGAVISVGYSKGKEELTFKVGGKKDAEEPAEEENNS